MATLGLGLGVQRQVSRWDADALAYIAQVEVADGQALEPEVKLAMNRFVKQCKRDASPVAGVSNWQAMKATCLLAGARTLAGALVPLKGPAPTNYNFVSGDYNRATGMKGDGSTKYLATGYNNAADPDDNRHIAAFSSDRFNFYLLGSGGTEAGMSQLLFVNAPPLTLYLRLLSGPWNYGPTVTQDYGFAGMSRQPEVTDTIQWVLPDGEGSDTATPAAAAASLDVYVFRRLLGTSYSNSRIAFYSIGEAVDLISLRSAVNTYMEDIA